MASDVVFPFRCETCHAQWKLFTLNDDPTNSHGACPVCGGTRWHIYAKDASGHVRIVM